MELTHEKVTGENIQQLIFEVLAESGLSYSEAIKTLAFVVARVLYLAAPSPDIARAIIDNKFSEGVLAAFDLICLMEAGQEPGQRPN
jgi:hypothetical protein